jgi:hypothetical protein
MEEAIMARILVAPIDSVTKTKTLIAPRTKRVIVDEDFASSVVEKNSRSGKRELRKKGPGGTIPKPKVQPAARRFIGIEPGCIVSVKGYRNTNFLVLDEASAEFKNKYTGEILTIKSNKRAVGNATVMVTLLGTDNLVM